MPCGVNSCSINDEHLLWKCAYCSKTYHAACIGVQRTRERFITQYVVPMCAECQEILHKEADVRIMLHQQEELLKAIRSQTDTNQRIAADLKKFSTVSALFDNLDDLLTEVKETLTMVNKSHQCVCTAIDQHMKSCDSRTTSTLTDIDKSNSTMSQKISNFIGERLTSLQNDMALLTKGAESLTTSLTHLSQESELREILDEVKFVAAAISIPKSSHGIPPHQKTLEDELAETPSQQPKHQQQQQHQQQQPQQKQQLQQTTGQQQPDSIPHAPEQLKQQQKQQPKQTTVNDAIADLFAERRAKLSKLRAEAPSNSDLPLSGWRILGSKRCWRQDWSGYDMKLNNRQLQEKAADKARQRRKRRSQQISPIRRHKPTDRAQSSKLHEGSRTMGSDKELLASAKAQFAGPPSITDHPIAGLSVPKLISFRKGETINAYRKEMQNQQSHKTVPLLAENNTPVLPSNNQQQQQPANQQLAGNQQQQEQNLASSSESRFELDPLRPPIVRLTEQSAEGDGRFLKARLRDPKIMRVVRLFLAYMKDQPATVCVDGMTPTSIRMHLVSEGLPSDPEHLLRIFKDVHQEYGMDPVAAVADLQSYQKYLSSERIHRLQQLRESDAKFRNPSFRK